MHRVYFQKLFIPLHKKIFFIWKQMKLWNMEYMKQDFLFENPEDLNESLLYSVAIS